MKNYYKLFFAFLLAFVCFFSIDKVYALETLPNANLDRYYYYAVDGSNGVCSDLVKYNPADLPTFGWTSSQETYIVGTTISFFGINYNANQEVYLKIYFYISDKAVFQQDQLEYSFGSSNSNFAIYPNYGSDSSWGNELSSSQYSKSYSYKYVGDSVEIVQTLKIKSHIAGNGFRIEWGNCDGYSTMATSPVYGKTFQFGVNSVEYQVLSNDNNVIIDQNQTIIDQNNKTNEELGNIKDNINDMEDSIIENNNQNTQDIIDSNKETQEVIKDQFNSCRDSYNLFNKDTSVNGTLNASGSISSSNDYSTSDFIEINSSKIYSISTTGSKRVKFFDENKNVITSASYEDMVIGNSSITFSSPFNNAKYIRFTFKNSYKDSIILNEGNSVKPYEPFGRLCSNKIDDTNEKLDNLNDTLNDDDVSDSENTAGGFFNDFSTTDNGGISGIITMPLKMINGLISGGNSCKELSFTILGKEVAFPSGCILWNKANNSVVILYQTLVCGFFGYILLIKLFNDIQNLKNPNSSEVSTLDL